MDLFARLGLALSIGLLVGVERGWRAREMAEGERTAGLRTFGLSGLLGGVSAALGIALGGWAFASLALPYAAAFVLFKQREQALRDDRSVTDVVAALLVFALGAYAVVGRGQVAAGAAVALTVILASKQALHGWLARLTWEELRSALIILAMSFVALPLLPDRTFGPYGLVNPHELWLLTIALAGVSFAAYVAVRLFGASRGLVVASVAGALVSSTAVTLYLARSPKPSAQDAERAAGAALIAGAVMAARIGLIVLALAPGLFPDVAGPLILFGAVSGLAGVFALWRSRDGEGGVTAHQAVQSPLELGLVLKSAAVIGVVFAVAKAATGLFGASGVVPVAGLAGLVDVDAAILAVARMTAQGLDAQAALQGVMVAAAAASITKTGIAVSAGGRFAAIYAGGTLLGALAAAVALAVPVI